MATVMHIREYTLTLFPQKVLRNAWWRHQMEKFCALLAICARNAPVTGEFPAQRPVTRRFDVFFAQHLNKRLDKQSWGWWFETPSRPLWRHNNGFGLHGLDGICYIRVCFNYDNIISQDAKTELSLLVLLRGKRLSLRNVTMIHDWIIVALSRIHIRQ